MPAAGHRSQLQAPVERTAIIVAHPLVALFDRIAAIRHITPAEMAVLKELARYSDWHDGSHAGPAIDTIADRTALSPISVQRALTSLSCEDAFCGRQRCQHRGLITCTAAAEGHKPALFTLTLTEAMFQPHLPEVGASLGSKRHVPGTPQTHPTDGSGASVG